MENEWCPLKRRMLTPSIVQCYINLTQFNGAPQRKVSVSDLTVGVLGLEPLGLYDHDAEDDYRRFLFAGQVQHAVVPIRGHAERPLAVQVQVLFVVRELAAGRRRPNLKRSALGVRDFIVFC